MGENYTLLVKLAQKGLSNIETSTIKLSKELKTSQQTISRKLVEMENNELIKRTSSTKGMVINIEEKGITYLKKNYQTLKEIFQSKDSIKGKIQSGIGEGGYYVSKYQEQFQKQLGFKAFPGTLNVKTNKEEIIKFITTITPIEINGFTTKERTFGSLICYKIKVNKQPSAIVIPERTRHAKEIIEIISSKNLRKTLKLKDNVEVNISK